MVKGGVKGLGERQDERDVFIGKFWSWRNRARRAPRSGAVESSIAYPCFHVCSEKAKRGLVPRVASVVVHYAVNASTTEASRIKFQFA